MQLKYIVIYVALWTFALAMASQPPISSEEEDEEDQNTSESKIIKSFSALAPGLIGSGGLDDLDSLPYDGPHAPVHTYGAPPVPQPSFGISLNTAGILAPQVEVLRLVEAFIKLKGEILARFHALLNDNWELVRAVLNLIIGKLQNLHAFSLKGISVFRKILEFALNLFADWSVTLPSITLGSAASAFVQPQAVYGAPAGNVASFLQGFRNQ